MWVRSIVRCASSFSIRIKTEGGEHDVRMPVAHSSLSGGGGGGGGGMGQVHKTSHFFFLFGFVVLVNPL